MTRSSSRFEKLRERLQRHFRDVVLDALGVSLRRFGRHAERAQEIDDESMAYANAIGERMAFLGEKNAAIGRRGLLAAIHGDVVTSGG